MGWLLLLATFLAAVPKDLLAQATGVIQGHISDPTGASVAQAMVSVKNEDTGFSRQTSTAVDGYYSVADLLPGRYEVRVEAPGFNAAVRSGAVVSAASVVGLDFTLRLGEVTESVEVTARGEQLETDTSRVSEVLTEDDVKALPVQGRGILNILAITPGIQGKAESANNFCCDSFSNFAAPTISSGGNENKSHISLDGLSLRYTEGSDWGALFSPNLDAVSEVRVSTNPYMPEHGRISGPQVEIVSKGGTNDWHGTAHFTAQDDTLNARPFFASNVPDSYTRYFGGTVGGPVIRNRLFVFGAYEGLREKVAASSVQIAETQEFVNLLSSSRPNSIAASLLGEFAPFQYPNRNLVDIGSPGPEGRWIDQPDGIADLGEVSLDDPNARSGKQFNGRADYQSAEGNDRVYGSYWYTRPTWVNPALRKAFQGTLFTRVNSGNVVYTRLFSPRVLNEAKFSITNTRYQNEHSGAYHVPGVSTFDGLSLGNFGWSREEFLAKTIEIGDIISINRGRHNLKMGVDYRRGNTVANSLLPGSTPEYAFGSILDFANDEPLSEFRVIDISTGGAASPRLDFILNELSMFFQDTWQVTPNLTINYGLRWESFFSNWLQERDNWQPNVGLEGLNPGFIGGVRNQKVDRFYNTDWNNFSPRLGFAWDPTGQRKLSIRGNVGLLYDEIHTVHLYGIGDNPPTGAALSAGVEVGIPVVYGLAPVGTRDFPNNTNLPIPELSETGGIVGARVGLNGMQSDLKVPMVLNSFVGVQYQLANDFMVEVDYKYRRATNDVYNTDFNRIAGDLVDGLLDRINPDFNAISLVTNLGRRESHSMIFWASKRFSEGWSASASYTYTHAKDNYGQQTDPFEPGFDWARADIPHVFNFHSVWELPILRGRTGWLAGAFGGWQLNNIWNFQSGNIYTPVAHGLFGSGGDFNADGRGGDRPDRPAQDLPRSFSNDEWLNGALTASQFPLPDPSTQRRGTLPRDLFRLPGYIRVDTSLVKEFPLRAINEGAKIQVRAEAFNLLNRLNISSVDNSLESASFGRAVGAFQNRRIQMGLKLIF